MKNTRLLITEQQLDTIRHHAQSTYPEEGGGLLLGRNAEDGVIVTQIRTIPNTWEVDAERRRRYLIPSTVMLREMRSADNDELDIVGYFHSHPDHPAVPSEFDREHALPGWSYVIVSVCDGRTDHINVWRLRDDRSAFDADEISVTA